MQNNMYQLDLNVRFDASIESLFNAWHKPELLLQWFAPGDMLVTQAMSSFKVGGKYRIAMQDNNAEQYTVFGEYLAIDDQQTLKFSWHWLDSDEISQVDLAFTAINDSTSELNLTHHGFLTEESRDLHQQGWIGCLEKLSVLTL
ncbi:SRPBCC domain-containing protein [Alteromonadaceae bacterium BrNp21-10]|nr:SRPBCC domain-containing protein [Alteromonadaceae bacterium BrNp21-10]